MICAFSVRCSFAASSASFECIAGGMRRGYALRGTLRGLGAVMAGSIANRAINLMPIDITVISFYTVYVIVISH